VEKYLEVLKRTTELSDTCLEGLEHIKGKLNDGHFEETIQLMNDMVIAFSQIESSIQLIIPQLSSNNMESLTNSLRSAFEHTVFAYEQGQREKVIEIFQFTLQPAFKRWSDEWVKISNNT